MIAQLTGSVITTHTNPITLDVHDVGYAVYVPEKMLATLRDGEKLTVYIHTHVREDALILFGFSSREERAIFNLLLTVSGIGPKTALLVMDHGATAVQTAIGRGDVDFFTSIPRLGKKNAQKIIIELRNKMIDGDFGVPGETSSETTEIMEALLSMGFDRKEIREVIKKLPNDTTLEKKITRALQLLGK